MKSNQRTDHSGTRQESTNEQRRSAKGCAPPALLGCTGLLAFLKVAGTPPFDQWSWVWIAGPLWIPIVAVLVGILGVSALAVSVSTDDGNPR